MFHLFLKKIIVSEIVYVEVKPVKALPFNNTYETLNIPMLIHMNSKFLSLGVVVTLGVSSNIKQWFQCCVCSLT